MPSRSQLAQLRVQDARVAKAEAQRQLAVATVASAKRLFERATISRDEADRAQVELAIADAVLREAQAERDQAGIQVAHAKAQVAALEYSAKSSTARRLSRSQPAAGDQRGGRPQAPRDPRPERADRRAGVEARPRSEGA